MKNNKKTQNIFNSVILREQISTLQMRDIMVRPEDLDKSIKWQASFLNDLNDHSLVYSVNPIGKIGSIRWGMLSSGERDSKITNKISGLSFLNDLHLINRRQKKQLNLITQEKISIPSEWEIISKKYRISNSNLEFISLFNLPRINNFQKFLTGVTFSSIDGKNEMEVIIESMVRQYDLNDIIPLGFTIEDYIYKIKRVPNEANLEKNLELIDRVYNKYRLAEAEDLSAETSYLFWKIIRTWPALF